MGFDLCFECGAVQSRAEVEQVSAVEGDLIMERFVSEEQDFVLDPLWDGEPAGFSVEQGGCGHGSERAVEQQSFVCTGLYLGSCMMCHKE